MLSKILKSFPFAIHGIATMIKTETNAKFHFIATIIVIALGLYKNIQANDWLWLGLAISLVWIIEAMNTAIEELVDFVSPGHNNKAGKIKDIAAGAVLIASIFALFIGIKIFLVQ